MFIALFNAIVFGAFVGFLTDYWLGRAGVAEPKKLIVAVVVAVVTAVLTFMGILGVF